MCPAGQKTLTFQDRGWDKSRGGYVNRRVTVLGCERYGLPTALDEDVVLGLLQLTWRTGFGGSPSLFQPLRLNPTTWLAGRGQKLSAAGEVVDAVAGRHAFV